MQFATGSYVGDGNDDRSITVGFQPDLFMVKSDAANVAYFRTSSFTGDDSSRFDSGATASNRIQAFEATGVQIGTAAEVNTLNEDYYWAAFKMTGADDFHVGTYSGNDTDNRSITGAGFQPTVAFVKRDGNSSGVWLVDENGADDCMSFVNVANTTNLIQAFEADGIQVGDATAVNASGNTYYWAAWTDTSEFIETGTYTGNSTDDRSITGAGFQPTMVWVKGDTTQQAVFAIDTMDAGDSAIFAAGTPKTNRIQDLESDGFQVGTDGRVNANSIEYYWAAWKTGTSTVGHAGSLVNSIPLKSKVHGSLIG
jgi:hypothetical protein